MCRRAHGAPYVTWVGFPRKDFHVTSGRQNVLHYQSSPQARRSFCGRCGSPFAFESTRWPDEIHLARACLPDELALSPQGHCYFDDRACWADLSDHLPRFGAAAAADPG